MIIAKVLKHYGGVDKKDGYVKFYETAAFIETAAEIGAKGAYLQTKISKCHTSLHS